MPQLKERVQKALNYRNLSAGLYLLSIGLLKKVAIADRFSQWASAGFDGPGPLNFFYAWATSLSYTFQIYYDFSGYTDMALGAALMFNIKLPVNFDSPYKALDVQDFWRRWHISLSRFLRDYVYIPLGGSRVGEGRIYFNLMVVFLVCGLWHGAGWTFIFWGFLYGAAVVVRRFWRKMSGPMPDFLAWFLTFNFVNAAWVFFRARTWEDALKVLSGMVGLNGFTLPSSWLRSLDFSRGPSSNFFPGRRLWGGAGMPMSLSPWPFSFVCFSKTPIRWPKNLRLTGNHFSGLPPGPTQSLTWLRGTNFSILIFRGQMKVYRKWFFLALGILLSIVGLAGLTNYIVDPYGLLRKDFTNQFIEPNKNFIKIRFITQNLDRYDSFVFGSSRVNSINVQKIQGYKCYNVHYNGGLPRDHLDNIRYLLKKGVKIKLILLGLDDMSFRDDPGDHLHQPLRYPYPPVLNQHPFPYYLRYFFSSPDWGILQEVWYGYKKMLFKASGDHPVFYDMFDTGQMFSYQIDRQIEDNPEKHRNDPKFLIIHRNRLRLSKS